MIEIFCIHLTLRNSAEFYQYFLNMCLNNYAIQIVYYLRFVLYVESVSIIKTQPHFQIHFRYFQAKK